jgi:N utilization substance protein B
VLRAILRAGAYELAFRKDVPARVTISEYVDVAHSFYGGEEPGLVNAVLDTIAREVRPDDMKERARSPSRSRG